MRGKTTEKSSLGFDKINEVKLLIRKLELKEKGEDKYGGKRGKKRRKG